MTPTPIYPTLNGFKLVFALRRFHTKARKQLPDMWFDNDNNLIFKINEAVNGARPLAMTPCELFGFGTGDYFIGTVAEANDDPNTKIPFCIQNDLSHVVVATTDGDESQKELKRVCVAIADALQEHGLAHMGVQHYKLTQSCRPDESELRLRYNITPQANTTYFVPDDSGESESGAQIRRHHSLGQGIVGNLEALPSEMCAIVWDVDTDASHPPSFKPLKAKFWLVCNVTLEPGKFYMMK